MPYAQTDAAGNIPAVCQAPSEAFQLLAGLLDFDPNTRLTAAEALEHEYFKQDPLPSMDAFCLVVGRALRHSTRSVRVETGLEVREVD